MLTFATVVIFHFYTNCFVEALRLTFPFKRAKQTKEGWRQERKRGREREVRSLTAQAAAA